MPRTNLPVQVGSSRTPGVIVGGSTATEVTGDQANNHSFINGDGVHVIVRGSGGASDVTFLISKAVDSILPVSVAQSVASAVSRVFGPFPPADYNQSDGTVNVNVNAGTGANLKLEAIQFKR